ncbi:MAG: hypothetical protein NTY32_05660, partial [Bacteroidia bacterium]|nr:hypothetical protein [Bacteroidia bacterium]
NKIAKSMASTTDWRPSINLGAIGNDLTKNNTFGFKAMPGGYRSNNGKFDNIGMDGVWWSTTEDSFQYSPGDARGRNLGYYFYDLRLGEYQKSFGVSVRCIKD